MVNNLLLVKKRRKTLVPKSDFGKVCFVTPHAFSQTLNFSSLCVLHEKPKTKTHMPFHTR
jgi:hypothetical protein